MRLAIVDSEPVVGEVLAAAARRRGHQVVCVADVARLMSRLPFEPSAVIVSLDGRDESGPRSVVTIRQRFPDQVLMVTVERPPDPFTRSVLRAGADDVVRIPYHPGEVLLKVENSVARQSPQAHANAMEIGDLAVDLDRYTATKNGVVLTLTKLELRLLYALCEHSPHLAPIERLLSFGWDGQGDPDPSLIKTHMSHIRKKLSEAGGVSVEISSRQTLGYSLRVAEV